MVLNRLRHSRIFVEVGLDSIVQCCDPEGQQFVPRRCSNRCVLFAQGEWEEGHEGVLNNLKLPNLQLPSAVLVSGSEKVIRQLFDFSDALHDDGQVVHDVEAVGLEFAVLRQLVKGDCAEAAEATLLLGKHGEQMEEKLDSTALQILFDALPVGQNGLLLFLCELHFLAG